MPLSFLVVYVLSIITLLKSTADMTLNTYTTKKDSGISQEQIEWQEERSKRKIRKLDFEVR